MTTFYKLEPEAAGELGPESIIDTTTHPPKVEKVDYILQSWLGDCVLETFPVYLVTDTVVSHLKALHCTGYDIEDIQIKKVDPLKSLKPHLLIPTFKWLKVNGIAGVDDFGMKDHSVVVSQKVLDILRRHGLKYCTTEKL